MKFSELEFNNISETHGEGAVQAYVKLKNGFDVSVVKHKYSYGGDKGLYEIGVFDAQRSGVEAMCDPLEWGDTVKGWLAPEDVESYIHQIEKV